MKLRITHQGRFVPAPLIAILTDAERVTDDRFGPGYRGRLHDCDGEPINYVMEGTQVVKTIYDRTIIKVEQMN